MQFYYAQFMVSYLIFVFIMACLDWKFTAKFIAIPFLMAIMISALYKMATL